MHLTRGENPEFRTHYDNGTAAEPASCVGSFIIMPIGGARTARFLLERLEDVTVKEGRGQNMCF